MAALFASFFRLFLPKQGQQLWFSTLAGSYDVRTFIREIRQYATIQELDEGILNRLISRILVGEVKKVDGEKFQEIKIIYNFVGEIPAVTE